MGGRAKTGNAKKPAVRQKSCPSLLAFTGLIYKYLNPNFFLGKERERHICRTDMTSLACSVTAQRLLSVLNAPLVKEVITWLDITLASLSTCWFGVCGDAICPGS